MNIDDHAEDYAKKLIGNWKSWNNFYWNNKPEDADNWCIIYTHNRDSQNLELSNASCIDKELEEFLNSSEDLTKEIHNHWACGWVEGYAIRVLDESKNITNVFKKYVEIQLKLEEYPVLDEDDLSQRDYKDTIEAINSEGKYLLGLEHPDDWEAQVFTWLFSNKQSSLEDNWPSKKDIKEALIALNIQVDD